MNLKKEYKEITKNILENENYLTLKNDTHHGSTRYDHCKRVSELSFFMAKIFKGNATDDAISGLLHDFFHGTTNDNEDISYLNHPMVSIENAKKYFSINENEENTIKTHMYHYALVKQTLPFINKRAKVKAKDYKPKNRDGYIVCISDLLVTFYEAIAYKVPYKTCLYALFTINLMLK